MLFPSVFTPLLELDHSMEGSLGCSRPTHSIPAYEPQQSQSSLITLSQGLFSYASPILSNVFHEVFRTFFESGSLSNFLSNTLSDTRVQAILRTFNFCCTLIVLKIVSLSKFTFIAFLLEPQGTQTFKKLREDKRNSCSLKSFSIFWGENPEKYCIKWEKKRRKVLKKGRFGFYSVRV